MAKSSKAVVPLQEALPPSAPTKEYVPTLREIAAVERVRARRTNQLPKVKINKGNDTSTIQFEHPDSAVAACKLAEAIGADDVRLADHLLLELAQTTANGAVLDQRKLEYAITIVEGIKPGDTVECLLATQMAGIHMAAMKGLRYMRDAQSLEVQEAAANMTNKMMRTFAMQVEALKKHRSAGEQVIKVQHVTVNEGGQAVVGIVNKGGGGTPQIERQPHELSHTDAPGTPLLGHVEAVGQPLQGASGEGMERMPLSRGGRRSTQRAGKRSMAPRQTH